MAVYSQQFCICLIFCRVGTLMGYLPIKYNPLKLNGKGSPFETSRVLLIYSFILWLLCTIVSIHTVRFIFSHIIEHTSFVCVLVLGTQMSFIFWIVMARKSIPQILNKFAKLILDHSTLQVSCIECFIPYFPLMISFPVEAIINFRDMMKYPSLTFLDLFERVGTVFTNGLIYTWILCAEKLCLDIDHQIRSRARILSENSLRTFLTMYLEIESFLNLISKHCGIPYLTMSIVTITVNIIFSNHALYSVGPSKDEGLQQFLIFTNFVSWNHPLYIMACVCYRSHQLSNQVKGLKWTLDEIHTTGNLDMKTLKMVRLFETRINEKNMHFSAFGSINFDVGLIIVVLNKIVTYLFAISPTKQS